ncbi:MAG: murein transglycosylase A [Alphaproteobacteria bacterium]
MKLTPIKKIILIIIILSISGVVLYRYFKPDTVIKELPKQPDVKSNLVPTTMDKLTNFDTDDMAGAISVNKKSCSVFLRLPANKKVGTKHIPMTAGDMHKPCNELTGINDKKAFVDWLKNNFDVYEVRDDDGNNTGKFTGYFEAELNGSLEKTDKYKYPIYGLPKDMIFMNAKDWADIGVKESFVGMVKGNKFIPYYKRGNIDAMKMNAPILAYGADKTDIFLLHVQGSGRIKLDNGKVVRLGYAGNNGHKYQSMGKELIKQGHLTLAQASWDGIRNWLNTNTDKADKILAVNSRYIFFKYIGSSDGPIGKMGIGLTAKRSLAVDYKKIPMGLNIWLDADWDKDSRIQRLMNTQDTGSAIVGWIRGDFFWGYGNEALKYAGRMNSKGSYHIFLPKSIKNNIIRN